MPRNPDLHLTTTQGDTVNAVLQAQSDRLALLIPDVVNQCKRELELADRILDAVNGVQDEDGNPLPMPPGVDQNAIRGHLMRANRVREMMLRATGLAASAPQNTYVLAAISGPQASPINARVLQAVGKMLGLPSPDSGQIDVIEAEVIGTTGEG